MPVTSSSPRTCAESDATRPPLPWVPVEIAPATVCSAMSPMLCSVRPSSASRALRTWSGVPASAVTVIASRSTETIPVRASGSSSVSSATAIGVKLWPVPTILAVRPAARAARTAATTSSADRGAYTSRGRAEASPDQLRHSTRRAYGATAASRSRAVRGSSCATSAAATPPPTITR